MTMVIGLPPRFTDAKWRDMPDGKIKQAVRTYLEHFEEARGIGVAPLFLGRAGGWKTHGAAVIAKAVADRAQVETHFVSVPEIMGQLLLDRFNPELTLQLARLQMVPFLVMDDFTEAEPGSPMATILTTLISARFNLVLPTLWTGNLMLPEKREAEALTERYGPLFARRLLDGSKGYRVLITGKA